MIFPSKSIVSFIVVYRSLNKSAFPYLVLLYWIMSEGTLLVIGKSVQPFLYRNWLIEGVGFYYMGKWMREQESQRKALSIGMLIIGSIVTVAEYRICGRVEFYFGNLLMVYGMLALGKSVHLKDNILSMIGSKHSLHLYLYSPFVAFVFTLLQMILFQTTRHQEVITVLLHSQLNTSAATATPHALFLFPIRKQKNGNSM